MAVRVGLKGSPGICCFADLITQNLFAGVYDRWHIAVSSVLSENLFTDESLDILWTSQLLLLFTVREMAGVGFCDGLA